MITLNYVMRVNAVSCIAFGLIFLLIPQDVVAFLTADIQRASADAAKAFTMLGIGLILNGLFLAAVSLKPLPSKSLVLYFSITDFLWVLASIAILVFSQWITTESGQVVTLAIAVMVGVLGYLQLIKRKALGNG